MYLFHKRICLLLLLPGSISTYGQRTNRELQSATIRKLLQEEVELSEGDVKINDSLVTAEQWTAIKANTFKVEVLNSFDSLRITVFFLSEKNNILAPDSRVTLIKEVPCVRYKTNQRFFGVFFELYQNGEKRMFYRLLENISGPRKFED